MFVCTGNTCRSPLAEVMARKLAAEKGLKNITFASAGIGAYDGAAASEGAMLVALERGLDLSAHQAQPLTRELVVESDIILCMSEHHAASAIALGGEGKTFLLDEFASRGTTSGSVADPFGQQLEAYREAADDIGRQVAQAIKRISADGLPP